MYTRRVYIPADVLSGVECRPQWIPVVESIDPVHESGKRRRWGGWWRERDETELLDRKGEEGERGECWEANQRLP